MRRSSYIKKISIALAIGAAIYCSTAAVLGTFDPQSMVKRVFAAAESADAPPLEMKFRHIVIPGSSGERVYLFHGIHGDTSFWGKKPYVTLTSRLIDQRHEIVIAHMPDVLGRDIDDGGRAYCTAFRKWFDDTQRTLGKAEKTTIVGASWGGWHAMQLGNQVDRILIIKPVTIPSRLNEFWWTGKNLCPLFPAKSSLAIYAKTDPRVGDATKALAKLGIPTRESAQADHGMHISDLQAAIRWLEGAGEVAP